MERQVGRFRGETPTSTPERPIDLQTAPRLVILYQGVETGYQRAFPTARVPRVVGPDGTGIASPLTYGSLPLRLGLINSAFAQAGKGTRFGLEQTKQLGFDSVDLLADPLDMTAAERRLIADTCRELDLPIVSLCCVALGLIDFSPPVRRFHLDRCRAHLDLAADYGCRNLLLVLGEYVWQQEVIPPAEQWKLGVDAVRQLGAYAADRGLKFAIELEPFKLSLVNSIDTMLRFLDEVGLPRSVLTKKPVQLSGGMRKRAGLARALALDPQLMLYDEPTTGLDPIMSDVINELILRVHERPHVTSVVVTHDMHTARKVADRVIMLYPVFRLRPDEPQIVFDGTVEELDGSRDPRIRQFVEGRAGARLMELREEQARDHGIPAESPTDTETDTHEGEPDA